MIYVNKSLDNQPPVFRSPEMAFSREKIAEFYQSGASTPQKRFNDQIGTKYRKLFLERLRDEFHGKCAYCESHIDLAVAPSEFDHFRPKNTARGLNEEVSRQHYWWFVYEWRNIYYSCARCNSYKASWFPVEGDRAAVGTPYEMLHMEDRLFVDPCEDNPAEHLEYMPTGRLIGSSARGFTTIELLKLNRDELVQARKKAVDSLQESMEAFRYTYEAKADTAMLNEIIKEWQPIFSDNSPESYLGIKRYFIREFLKRYELDDYLINRNFVIETDQDLKVRIEKHLETSPNSIPFDFEQGSSMLSKEIDEIRHIFVEKLEIHNFKCFENLTINFTNGEASLNHFDSLDEPYTEPWILFLGENGMGKSSLLKAFTIGLAGRNYLEELGLSGSDLLRRGADSGYIKLHTVGSIVPAHVIFTATEFTSNIAEPLINFVAYNAIRLKHTPPHIIAEQSEYKGAKARSLFDFTASFIDCDSWLMSLPKERFDRVALTLKDLMSLDNEDNIFLLDGRTIVQTGNQVLSIDDLSDGYQSVFYMAIDIMATIELEGLPFELSEGMIIIDEIGAHLHPRWRMEVVGKLRRAFPKMRFVVSTHEPLCLRGMRAGETMVLQKSIDKKISLLTDLPDPSELRIDQILTSDFFGLNSTMDSQTEKHFSEYYQLLAKAENELSSAEIERLAELRKLVPKIRNLGDSERESIIYDVVDKLLAEKKAGDPFRNVQEIKKEAFARLQKIWNIK
ncbi:uncharacterized protein (TIGR02646 family) [Pedobacter sp. AK013]|uniref:AAA family ATPase n=1 Tax=Pedobacter sp. AK013 TaxID=2723071 RepID=UPI00160DF679|nr:AAA family ATPase [Pedobacter sp. AK013]MBB6239953.1 uncharacterized protein (TIGR02646 family) [Pedobacter sp. AK013]